LPRSFIRGRSITRPGFLTDSGSAPGLRSWKQSPRKQNGNGEVRVCKPIDYRNIPSPPFRFTRSRLGFMVVRHYDDSLSIMACNMSVNSSAISDKSLLSGYHLRRLWAPWSVLILDVQAGFTDGDRLLGVSGRGLY